MDVEFKTNKLKKCYESLKKAIQEWGQEVGPRYIERVNLLKAIERLDDLQSFPQLHYHMLKGDREGQHAVRLTGFMRLIFTVEVKAVEQESKELEHLNGETEQGDMSKQIVKVEVIRIEEVSKHYD